MIEDEGFTAQEGGVRLDAALLHAFPTTTRAFVREAIANGDITVGGRRAAKGQKLRGGESVRVTALREADDNLVAPEPGLSALERVCGGIGDAALPSGDGRDALRRVRGGIGDAALPSGDGRGASPMRPQGASQSPCLRLVHSDPALLGLDKPAGMAVQPLTCRETGTLMNAVVSAFPECRELGRALAKAGENPLMAGALHRIDAGTSGLVLVARTPESFANLRAQFAAQGVRKTYLALVEGDVAVGGTLENDLVHDPTLPFCRMVDAHRNRLTRAQCARLRPLHAVTRFRPVGRTTAESETRTLLEVTIYTGVTHQIRAQLALAGMHVVNDRLYGAFAVEGQVGHCLHSLSAAFAHPVTGERTEIRTPLPPWAQGVGEI